MKYLFGPVNSRRLGLSQGIDLIPSGVCNFNCVYCEVTQEKKLCLERRQYTPTHDIIEELTALFADKRRVRALDVFTITASGEPTLHSGIGEIIAAVKGAASQPLSVLTNGGTLHLPKVRDALYGADIVIPSLDAARPQAFRRINRPAPGSELGGIISGIRDFTREFKGQVWLEILLVKGINDHPDDLKALREAVAAIAPERVQLNTVARPPKESFATALSRSELQAAAKLLDYKTEIIASFKSEPKEAARNLDEEELIALLRRRPGRGKDIAQALRLEEKTVTTHLRELLRQDRVSTTDYQGELYWQVELSKTN